MDDHKRILIAEDEKSIAHAYGEHLEREGYMIEYAYDGREAIIKTNEFKPDLILLDIVMPKLDGISVLKKLKASEETKNIPVIILTNLESSQSASEAVEAGSFQYLVKTNYTLDDITKKVAEVLKEVQGE
jgi:DNA-binding response OmpR family regulator